MNKDKEIIEDKDKDIDVTDLDVEILDLGLEPQVLEKLFRKNVERIYGLK